MSVPVPFSTAFVLLLLAVPGVWLLGRAAAHAVTRDRAARPALSAGLAVAFWICGVHSASLLFRSLRVGLPVGMITLALAGVAAEIVRRRRGASAGEGQAPSRWMLVTAIAAAAAIAPVALGYSFHDELLITGHMSIAAELQNGIYPPRHHTFADLPLRYHYGFDLLSASLTALLHLRVHRGIDAAEIGLFGLAWCLFWTLGERLIGRSRAFLAPLCALLGGALPLHCDKPAVDLAGHPIADMASRLVNVCFVGRHYLNPPTASYFFQHPWSIGIPMGVSALLVFTERSARREGARLGVLIVCLAALSMSQAALFVAFLPSFVVAEAWGKGGFSARRALRMAAVACVALGVAKLFGGFMTSAPGLPSMRFALHAGFEDTLTDTLLWNAETFGVALPLGVVGLFVLRRERLLFMLLVGGSLLVLNTIRYVGSEDIMKFATLATLMLGVLTASAIARLAPAPSPEARRAPLWRAALATSFVALTCLASATFIGLLDVGWSGVPAWFFDAPQEPTDDEGRAIAWIRSRVGPGDMVYRNAKRTYAFAQWGGLPQPWIQWTAKAFGFPEERIRARELLVRGRPADVDTYRREGFRYFVLDTSTEDALLRKVAQGWITAGRARRVATFGPLWIVELF